MTEGKAAKRGFITLATGKDEYYVLAHNLLMSYRFHSRSKVPFGIICDRRNEYTADFDTVVVMEDPQFSVFDKLKLPELTPFEETIGIEADCLAYRDLNGMWDVFKDGPDFGAFGVVLPLADDGQGWIRPEYLGPLKDRVHEQFLHQGGVYYMRKSRMDGFIQTCKDIRLHLDDFHFKLPNEEPVIALACMIHGYRPVKDWIDVFCFYPSSTVYKLDIRRGILRFKTPYYDQFKTEPFLVHWGTDNTRRPLYGREADTVVSLVGQGKHASPLIIKAERALYRFKEFIKPIVPVAIKNRLWKKIYTEQV